MFYSETFSTSTNVDDLVLAVKSRTKEYLSLSLLICDMAHNCWTSLHAAIDDLTPPLQEERLLQMYSALPRELQENALSYIGSLDTIALLPYEDMIREGQEEIDVLTPDEREKLGIDRLRGKNAALLYNFIKEAPKEICNEIGAYLAADRAGDGDTEKLSDEAARTLGVICNIITVQL